MPIPEIDRQVILSARPDPNVSVDLFASVEVPMPMVGDLSPAIGVAVSDRFVTASAALVCVDAGQNIGEKIVRIRLGSK